MYSPEEHTEETHNVLNEPMAYYVGGAVVALYNLSSIQKMGIVRDGVSKRYLEDFKKKAALDYDALAIALSVARATLINKKHNQKFSTKISEKILALADLYSFGYKTFEDDEAFNKWMFVPNASLNHAIPFDYIDNFYGQQEIRNLIGRIAYGVYS